MGKEGERGTAEGYKDDHLGNITEGQNKQRTKNKETWTGETFYAHQGYGMSEKGEESNRFSSGWFEHRHHTL